jgi:hypothetical protein
MDKLPNELLIEILLSTTNEKDLINLCNTNKRFYYLCKSEPVAKHIIITFIKIQKPNVFKNYTAFLKHYLQFSKNTHPDTVKYDAAKFYSIFDNMSINKIKRFQEKFN